MNAKVRAHHEEEHENAERWLLTYADLITLLLAVFVVLYSTAEQDTAKFKKVVGAMAKVFDTSKEQKYGPADGFGNSKEICLTPGDKMIQDIDGTAAQETGKETLESVQKSLEAESGLGKGLSTKMTELGLVINVEEQLLFPSGRTDFKPGAESVLAKLAVHLGKVANPIRINGHTDNVPITTRQFPSNWHLSSARAIKTAEFLIIGQKFPMQRIHVAGYADTAPAAGNNTGEGRARNRRVELVLVRGNEAPGGAGKAAPRALRKEEVKNGSH